MPFPPRQQTPSLKTMLENSVKELNGEPIEEIELPDTVSDSPLREATPDSADFLLDQINENLIAGMPEAITDDKLQQLIQIYRNQADRWVIDEAEKANKPRRTRKSSVSALDVGNLLD